MTPGYAAHIIIAKRIELALGKPPFVLRPRNGRGQRRARQQAARKAREAKRHGR